MRLLAVIDDADVARKILACLDLPSRAPPRAPARPAAAGPEEAPWEDPDWTFDQSPPDDDEWT